MPSLTPYSTDQKSDQKAQHAPRLRPLQSRLNALLNAWGQKLLLPALQNMTRGQLTLFLPDGRLVVCGQNDNTICASLTIYSLDFFRRCLLFGHIGFAESYIAGDWESETISDVIAWFILNFDQSSVLEGSAQKNNWINLIGLFNKLLHWSRNNSILNSRKNIEAHYDLSNDFFTQFLDSTMTYSSAKFDDWTTDLESAQIAKFESMCQALQLQPTDYVLEIGTGWGGFARYAAETYGCKLTTLTISSAQFDYATQRIREAGLENQITVLLKDYREMTGQFDKVVSIEMIEAVGDAYLNTYLAQCSALLKPHGLLGLQMITCPDSRYNLLKSNVDFIQKHIFPGSLLPSLYRVQQGLYLSGDLFMHTLTDMGNSYVATLAHWHNRFIEQMDDIQTLGFDEAFIRKWRYYFQYCHAAFKTRNITVVQAVYTRPNNLTLSKEFS